MWPGWNAGRGPSRHGTSLGPASTSTATPVPDMIGNYRLDTRQVDHLADDRGHHLSARQVSAAAPARWRLMLDPAVRASSLQRRSEAPGRLPCPRVAARASARRCALFLRVAIGSVDGGLDEVDESFADSSSKWATRSRNTSLSAWSTSIAERNSPINVSAATNRSAGVGSCTPPAYRTARAPWWTPTHRAPTT